MRVLVVEDDNGVAFVLTTFLDQLEYDVQRVATGAEAIGAAFDWKPDVVLLDLTLPDVAGAQVFERIRNLEGPASQVPIIVVSGALGLDDIGRRLGANGVIAKPFNLATVERVVRDAIRGDPP